MKLYVVLVLSVVISWGLVSCDEDELYNCGFTEGPFMSFKNDLDESIMVHYQNTDGLGDSLVCLSLADEQMPMDPHSSMMYFQISSSRGVDSLSVAYSVVVVTDKKNRQRLYLDNIRGQRDTTDELHQLAIPYNYSEVDSLGAPLYHEWDIDGCGFFIYVQ